MSFRGVPQFQKGAVLIVEDQKIATVFAASLIALGLTFSCYGAASALETNIAAPASASAATDAALVDVTVLENGVEVHVSTLARSVGALLEERNDRPLADDFVSPAANEPLVAGMRVIFRQAQPVEIRIGRETRAVRSAAATVGELLNEQHIAVAPGDDVTPGIDRPLPARGAVSVVRVSRWISHVRQTIAPALRARYDSRLALGTSHVVQRGNPGLRETTFRFVKRDEGTAIRTVLTTRVVRAPRPTIVLHGVGAYQSLAHVAVQGFASAMHFAGSALHMIATAYTAGCYGCTGMTASGLRAGFGIIAVDPSIIPLGTRLFIPGYGRAIAGDTGGSIRGHRVDLGFDSNGQALQWGNRAVTVYLLR